MSARRVCAALLALALLLGAALAVLCARRPQAEMAEPPVQAAKQVMITDMNVGSLAAAALSNASGSAALMVDGGRIVLLDAPQGAEMSDQNLKAFLYLMAHMPAVRTLGTIADPAEFGFDSYTAAVALLGLDGSRTRLFLGSEAPFDAGWYLMREGDDTLYLVDEWTAQMMQYGVNDFRQLDIFPQVSADSLSSLSRMTLISGGQTLDIHGLTQDGAVYFYMARPYDTLLSWEKVLNTLIVPLSSLDKAAYVSGDVSPAKYGLYDPEAIRLTTLVQGRETTLLFAPADETHLYCARKGADDVVLVRRADAAFLETQASDLLAATLYTRSAADVDSIRVKAQGAEGEMILSGAGMMLRGMIDSRTLDQAQTVDLYKRLTMLPPAQAIEAGQEIAGEPLLELTIVLKDGATDRIACIPLTDRRCAVMINGEAAFATYTATVQEIIRAAAQAFGA